MTDRAKRRTTPNKLVLIGVTFIVVGVVAGFAALGAIASSGGGYGDEGGTFLIGLVAALFAFFPFYGTAHLFFALADILESQTASTESGEATVYRRRNGSDTWHWCRNCPDWPTSSYDERAQRPSSGDLCSECKWEDRRGTCAKS